MATTSINTPFGGGSGYDLNTSLQEIAVNDLLGNYFSGLVGSYFGKKSSKNQLEKQIAYQKQMATWSALELPLLQRQGYEKAGINPLFAFHSGVGSQGLPSASALQMFHSMPNLGSNSHGSVDITPYKGELAALEVKAAKDAARQRDANLDLTRKEIEKKDAEINAINNTTSVSSAKEGRSSVLDWFDSLSDPFSIGFGYWLGKRKGKKPEPPVIPLKPIPSGQPKKIPYRDFIRNVGVPVALGVSAYGVSRGVVNNFVKQAQEEEKKKAEGKKSKYNPWEFSPIGGYWY